MTPDRTDRDLVLAFKAGELAAYDEMYGRYHSRVYGVCSRILRNSQDAEEASQETFLRAYQALHRFNGRYQLGAWLARIASNASVDQLRSKSRAPVVGLPNDQEPVSADDDPEKLVIGEYPRLTAAIGEVKPLHAQALAMRTLEGLSHQEIGERLSMSPAQVKALLHRARSSLRRAWDRAEGWVLAPVLSLRSLVNDRTSGQAGSPLMSVGGTLSPLLAERVAATALVVAVALGTFPAPPTAPRSEPRQRAPRPALEGVAVRPAEVRTEVSTASASDSAGKARGAVAEDIPRLIEQTLNGHTELSTNKQESKKKDDESVPRDIATDATNVVVEAQQLLPQGGPVVAPQP